MAVSVISCDLLVVPEENYDNPLDEEQQVENGLDTPALIFFPDNVTVGIGYVAEVQIYGMGLLDLAGTKVVVNYDKTKLSLLNVTEGSFFDSSVRTVFFFENDADNGTVTIYSSYLGGETVSVQGTGTLATLQFSTSLGGQSTIRFSPESEFADPDDNPIGINGFGVGVINAQ